jgi:hypothetical protein
MIHNPAIAPFLKKGTPQAEGEDLAPVPSFLNTVQTTPMRALSIMPVGWTFWTMPRVHILFGVLFLLRYTMNAFHLRPVTVGKMCTNLRATKN